MARLSPSLDVLLPPPVFLFQALPVGAGQIQRPRKIVPHARRTDPGLDVLLFFQKTTSGLMFPPLFPKKAGTFCKKPMDSLPPFARSGLFFPKGWAIINY